MWGSSTGTCNASRGTTAFSASRGGVPQPTLLPPSQSEESLNHLLNIKSVSLGHRGVHLILSLNVTCPDIAKAP